MSQLLLQTEKLGRIVGVVVHTKVRCGAGVCYEMRTDYQLSRTFFRVVCCRYKSIAVICQHQEKTVSASYSRVSANAESLVQFVDVRSEGRITSQHIPKLLIFNIST